MASVTPYLNFNRNCREAMSFYKDCLGGELVLQTVAEMPEMAAQMPPEWSDCILHSTLISGSIMIFGSDLSKAAPVEGNTVQLCINCDSEEELITFFQKLAVGGKINDPIADMPWGAKYGVLTDRYGKQWLFNFQNTKS